MENTSENKEKFFSQYFNQKVLANTQGTHYPLVNLDKSWNWSHSDFYLELTPLTQITDEDIKEIEVIEGYTNYEACKNYVKEHSDDRVLTSVSVDYLRSKGYALPFLDLSVEDLIEYGWVKLKE